MRQVSGLEHPRRPARCLNFSLQARKIHQNSDYGIAVSAGLPYIDTRSHHPALGVVLHSVLETSVFTRKADALLTREERAELIATLARAPLAGAVIPGTGGVRKLRLGAAGRGKRGGFRVIYYMLNEEMPLVAIVLYGKNEQADLTPTEKRGAEMIVAAMKAEMDRRKATGGKSDGRRGQGT